MVASGSLGGGGGSGHGGVRQQRLEGGVGAEEDRSRQGVDRFESGPKVGVPAGVPYVELGFGVAQVVVEFRSGEARVERQADGAETHGGEVEVDEREALGKLQGHAVAGADATRFQEGRGPAHGRLELAVAHAQGATRLEAFEGDLVGLAVAGALKRFQKQHRGSLPTLHRRHR